jgi:hypothetical protein
MGTGSLGGGRRPARERASSDPRATLFGNWTQGPFEKSFFDLALATRALKTLELQDIQKLLSENGSRGSEVFEAFGMKFPAGQITLWGALLILGIQLYMLAYLRQFFEKLQTVDESPTTPWIGMDSSRLASSMFFTTIVPLPCLAMASLGISFWYKPLGRWTGGTWTELVALVIAMICCFFLALSCWANRLFAVRQALKKRTRFEHSNGLIWARRP